jgi:hypothetical protein
MYGRFLLDCVNNFAEFIRRPIWNTWPYLALVTAWNWWKLKILLEQIAAIILKFSQVFRCLCFALGVFIIYTWGWYRRKTDLKEKKTATQPLRMQLLHVLDFKFTQPNQLNSNSYSIHDINIIYAVYRQ